VKSCLNCGRPAPIDAPTCEYCGREYAYTGEVDGESISLRGTPQSDRPTGNGAKTTGIILAVLGVLAILFSMLISPSDYSGVGEIDQDQVVLKAALSMLGERFLQIGLVVWLAGYIVNAISFLPGRED
jgi:hypothetical protein